MSRKRARLAEPLVRSQGGVSSCKRCRLRKIKCDDGYPRCDGCTKADVLCIVPDQSTTRDHTRAEVQSLEHSLSQLEALLLSGSRPVNGAGSSIFNEHMPTPCDTGPDNDSQFTPPPATTNRIQRPMSRQRQQRPESLFQPNPLPPYAYAAQVVTEYFREFHVSHPILDQNEVGLVLRAIYNDAGDLCMPERPFTRTQKRQLFQLNMVLAIGSIKFFHESSGTLHPFGFFTAALEASPPSEFEFNEASDVENLLLIAHFGLFYNIGCSIWELGRLCVRICIELQFHRQQSTPADTAMVAQQRRHVFWESYLLDRFSSSILGRPFAVEDEAISVVPRNSSGEVFDHLLRIGRITSNMHISIYHPTSQTETLHADLNFDRTSDPAGLPGSMNALFHLRKFHSQLQTWKLEAPTYAVPTCVYETAEFFEITLQESRLWLFRAVIHELPEGQLEIRHRLSVLCHLAAQRILACFSDIKGNNLFSSNRSLARLILISGLMIISTIKIQSGHGFRQSKAHSYSDIDINFWLKDIALDSATYSPDLAACSAALDTCEQHLSWLASSTPEVSAYAQLFRKLRSEVEATLRSHPALEREEIGQTFSDERLTTSAAAVGTSQQLQDDWTDSVVQPDGTLRGQGSSTSAHFVTTSAISNHTTTLEVETAGNWGSELMEGGSLWSFSNEPWMDGIEGDLSGLIWDTAMPWQWSPFTNM